VRAVRSQKRSATSVALSSRTVENSGATIAGLAARWERVVEIDAPGVPSAAR
jgi:hypothetical protein